MWKLCIFLNLVLFSGAALSAESLSSVAIPLDLYILSGQSNASGRINTNTANSNYSALAEVDDDILYYYRTDGQSGAAFDVTSGGDFLTLAPLTTGHIGPEITMMRKIHEQSTNKIALVKISDGATRLDDHWNSTSEGVMWLNWIADTTDAINDLKALGYAPTLKGILWLQGESDNQSEAMANRYENSFVTLIADMLDHLNGLDLNTTKTRFVTALIHNHKLIANRAIVRSAQRNVMGRNANHFYFDTNDLTTFDGTHFDESSVFIIGERFADYLLAAPTIDCSIEAGNEVVISFTGILQSSQDLINWTPLSPQPNSPYSIVQSEAREFFRAE